MPHLRTPTAARRPVARWRRFGISRSRREQIRTNLWMLPGAMVALGIGLFALTLDLDRAVAAGRLSFPGWVSSGGPDTARQLLIAIAAAVITVAGVVFSITILVLQLASQQFGPRMLRNFIRDVGTQGSLGAFVATLVYSTLTLVAVSSAPAPTFVPHLSATVSVALLLVDLCVLIYFIDHVATSIQLPSVVSGIARDFRSTLTAARGDAARLQVKVDPGSPEIRELAARIREAGAPVKAPVSGFLQAIGHERLLAIATAAGARVRLLHRPGHFIVAGQALAYVDPPAAAAAVAAGMRRSHFVGPTRTLTQDPGFAVDQLVEVAIRALSPAVNDTFTALNCIDWLGDCLCRACAEPLPSGVYRDAGGEVRLIEPALTQERLIKGATDKIRQAGRGMPAVLIRQLENLTKVMGAAHTPLQRETVLHHAGMILAAADGSILEASDRADVQAAFDRLRATADLLWQG